MGPIPSGRLKHIRSVDKWLSLRLCHSVRGMSVPIAWHVLVQLEWVK